MNTIAVHFQVHFEVRPFRNWNRDCGKWLELGRRKLLRTGRTGTGVPNGKEHLQNQKNYIIQIFYIYPKPINIINKFSEQYTKLNYNL